jgi:hypothetical protein
MIFSIRSKEPITITHKFYNHGLVRQYSYLHPDLSLKENPYFWEEDDFEEFVRTHSHLIHTNDRDDFVITMFDAIDSEFLTHYLERLEGIK